MRLRLWVAILTLAAVGAGIGWIYTHPPLEGDHVTRRHQGDRTEVYGLGLRNAGRWPLRLTRVMVNGENWEYHRRG